MNFEIEWSRHYALLGLNRGMLSDVFKRVGEATGTEERVTQLKPLEYMEQNRSTKSSGNAIISEDVEFKGTLCSSSRLEIHGRFEGEIFADGPLVIGESAVVKADIESESSVTVRGKVQGNINAKEKVEVSGNAQLYGDVSAPRFGLAETATFVGKTDTLGGKPPANDFSNIFTRLDKSKSAK
ncbi:MAG: polymer-forming cytoskeletal protein [Methylacidiphilales bacterium]|nr:polymer-forming cytoskeletal protein [Candidatus Methylacidiphilales bacterium]